jgi:hypothetical protein
MFNNVKNKERDISDKPSNEKDNKILVEFTTDGGLDQLVFSIVKLFI